MAGEVSTWHYRCLALSTFQSVWFVAPGCLIRAAKWKRSKFSVSLKSASEICEINTAAQQLFELLWIFVHSSGLMAHSYKFEQRHVVISNLVDDIRVSLLPRTSSFPEQIIEQRRDVVPPGAGVHVVVQRVVAEPRY